MKKLKKILLINWLYFSKELIEVSDVNFLTGKNGAGKSTVIDALQIVLLGETNARNFNQAANEKSQRTLDGYLRADMDENNPYSRRGKDFSSYIACRAGPGEEAARFYQRALLHLLQNHFGPARPAVHRRRCVYPKHQRRRWPRYRRVCQQGDRGVLPDGKIRLSKSRNSNMHKNTFIFLCEFAD